MALQELGKVAGAIWSPTEPADPSFLWAHQIDYPAQPNLVDWKYHNGTSWVLLRTSAYFRNPVLDDLNTPPGAPNDGDRYIVGAAPTGLWTGEEQNIAEWDDTGGVWTFYTPVVGDITYHGATSNIFLFNGTWGGVTGTIETSFDINQSDIGGNGIKLKADAGGLDIRDVLDAGYVDVRAGLVQAEDTFTFDGDTNTKLYHAGADNVQLVAGGVVVMDMTPTLSTFGTVVSGVVPTIPAHLATKGYVDTLATGLNDFKQSARAASTANIDLSTGTLLTIDGVTLIADNRVLVKDQSVGSQNGIYQAKTGSWVRTTDFDEDGDATAGAYIFVTEGTANQDTGWIVSTNDPIIIDTTTIDFVQFSAAGQLAFSNGLVKAGLDVKLGGSMTQDTTIDMGNYELALASGPSGPSGNVFSVELERFGGQLITRMYVASYYWLAQAYSDDGDQNSRMLVNNQGFYLDHADDDLLGASALAGTRLNTFWRWTPDAGANHKKIEFDAAGMTITDDVDSAGFVYAADYTANFVDLSLIHKGFGDLAYWKTAGNSTLTGATLIKQGGNSLEFQSNDTSTRFEQTINNSVIELNYNLSGVAKSIIQLNTTGALIGWGGGQFFRANDGDLHIADGDHERGLRYWGDYSVAGIAEHGDRWITDKGHNDLAYWNTTGTSYNVGSPVRFRVKDWGILQIQADDFYDTGLNITNNLTSNNTSWIDIRGEGDGGIAYFVFDLDDGIGLGPGVYFRDSRTVPKGIFYLGDYSVGGLATHGDRWIPDWGNIWAGNLVTALNLNGVDIELAISGTKAISLDVEDFIVYADDGSTELVKVERDTNDIFIGDSAISGQTIIYVGPGAGEKLKITSGNKTLDLWEDGISSTNNGDTFWISSTNGAIGLRCYSTSDVGAPAFLLQNTLALDSATGENRFMTWIPGVVTQTVAATMTGVDFEIDDSTSSSTGDLRFMYFNVLDATSTRSGNSYFLEFANDGSDIFTIDTSGNVSLSNGGAIHMGTSQDINNKIYFGAGETYIAQVASIDRLDFRMGTAGNGLISFGSTNARFGAQSWSPSIMQNILTSLPSYTWDTDSTMGMGRLGVNHLGLYSDGFVGLSIDTTATIFYADNGSTEILKIDRATDQVLFAGGTAALPAIAFGSDDGLYSDGSFLAWSQAGTARYVWDNFTYRAVNTLSTNLGSSGVYWKELFVGDIKVKNASGSGNATITMGSTNGSINTQLKFVDNDFHIIQYDTNVVDWVEWGDIHFSPGHQAGAIGDNRTVSFLSDGSVEMSPDTDQVFKFGRMQVDSRITDLMYISHVDMTGTTEYAFRQNSTGGVVFNGAGTTEFRIADQTLMKLRDGSGFGMQLVTNQHFSINAGGYAGVDTPLLVGMDNGDTTKIGDFWFMQVSNTEKVLQVQNSALSLQITTGTAGANSDFFLFGRAHANYPGRIVLDGGIVNQDTTPGDSFFNGAQASVAATSDVRATGASVTIAGGNGSLGTGAYNGAGGDVNINGGNGAGTGLDGVVRMTGTKIIAGSLELQDGSVSTTDATANVTLKTIPLDASTTYIIEASIISSETDATPTEYGAYKIVGVFQRIGAGGAVQNGATQAPFTPIESTGSMDANFLVSGNNVLVRVTGVAATNMNWKVVVSLTEVDSN